MSRHSLPPLVTIKNTLLPQVFSIMVLKEEIIMKKILVFLLVAGLIFALVPSFASESQANRKQHNHRFSWGEEGAQDSPHCPRENFNEARWQEEDSKQEEGWQSCQGKATHHQMRRRMVDPENCPRR